MGTWITCEKCGAPRPRHGDGEHVCDPAVVAERADQERIAALEARVETLTALLRALEWSAELQGAPACPSCEAWSHVDPARRWDSSGQPLPPSGKHRDGCALAAALEGGA